jgi:hypothetical protein
MRCTNCWRGAVKKLRTKFACIKCLPSLRALRLCAKRKSISRKDAKHAKKKTKRDGTAFLVVLAENGRVCWIGSGRPQTYLLLGNAMSHMTPLTDDRTTHVAPEERFWKRYSPHHEFPLSSITSVALHVLAFVLLALVAWWVAKMTLGQSAPLPETVISIKGGDGSNRQGGGDDAGGQPATREEETGNQRQSEDASRPQPNSERPKLVKPAPVPPLVIDDPENAKHTRDLIKAGEQAFQRFNQETREGLRKGRVPSQGKDASGQVGGKDRGPGPDKGNKVGPRGGGPENRLTRSLRWVMIFETYNGEDYARQLAALGAFIAVPQGKGDIYLVVRDLSRRPLHGSMEDVTQIKRIYWEDNKRESITPLCKALGIEPVPDHIVAFFPEKLEKELLRIELQYKNKQEHEIYETRFKVHKTATGYAPIVIDQTFN